MSVDEKRFLCFDEISMFSFVFILFALPFEKPPT